MGRRILNVAFVLGGILLVISSSRLLLRHEYVFLYHHGYHHGLSDNPKRWVPTFVPLFMGIWVSYCGVVGLIDERRRKSHKSI
jgi:hypothetical protein